MQSHRQQPTRLPRPWDSPGKNTGVGCHFLLQYMKVKSESEVTQSCLTQRPHGLQPTRLLHPWDSPGKSTGVGCHCLLWVQGELGLKWRNREDIKNVYSSVHLGTWGIILALTRRNLWREEFVFSWLCFVLIHFSRVRLWAMPQTVACRAPLSVGFFRILQEYWTGLPFPSSGIFQTQGWKLHLFHLLRW